MPQRTPLTLETPTTLPTQCLLPNTSWQWYQHIVQQLPGMSPRHPAQAGPPVYDDVRLLGALLGRVISKPRGLHTIEGPDLFLLIERLRRATKKADADLTQAKTPAIEAALQEGLAVFPPEQHDECIRKTVGGFRLFLELATMAENFHAKFLTGLNTDYVATWATNNGIPMADAYATLASLRLRFVSTAHPTQVYRETYLRHEQHILAGLSQLHQAENNTDAANAVAVLEATIETLWLTRFERWERPTVKDEAQGLMPYLTTMMETLPVLLVSLQPPDNHQPSDALLQTVTLGSWIGGDMDGNPYTNADTLAEILTERRRWLLQRYEAALLKLAPEYSYSHLTAFQISPPFEAQLEERYQWFSQLTPTLAPVYAGKIHHFAHREPIRQALLLLAAQLHHAQHTAWQPTVTNDTPTPCHPEVVLAQLADILTELRNNQLTPLALQPLLTLQQEIHLFGFHLVGIDLREEASVIQQTVTDWVGGQAPTTDSAARHAWLCEQLAHTEAPPCHIAEAQTASSRLMRMLQLVAHAQQWVSPAIGQHVLLSMTHHAHDVLAALLLCRWCGISNRDLKLVPLFETIDDLRRAPDIMTTLFQEPGYANQLQGKQIVLMAYSDSNKDGGFLTSQWHLYQAQQTLTVIGQTHGITVQFYHGRGGSIGRGGGPTQRFIQSLPTGTTTEGLQITEQGEVLTHHYLSAENTFYHWQQYVTSFLDRSFHPPKTPLPEWLTLMATLSEKAYAAYTDLKGMPGFIHYFEATTPREIDSIHIGSRPAHRKQINTLSDLRAIPWVFRWYQSRTLLPGWYGLGSAVQQVLQASPESLATLQTMYQAWPFFASLLDNSATTLLQADEHLMASYADLGKTDTEQAHVDGILHALIAEHRQTVTMVLAVTQNKTLLASPTAQAMKRSFEMKRPYLDPLNYLQIYLLKQYRQADLPDHRRDIIHRGLISSVGGVVAGLGVAG